MAKRLAIGEQYEATSELIDAHTRHEEGRARNRIALAIVGTATVFLAGAAVVGLDDRSFDEVNAVWNVIAPFAGGLVGYFFGVRATESPSIKQEK